MTTKVELLVTCVYIHPWVIPEISLQDKKISSWFLLNLERLVAGLSCEVEHRKSQSKFLDSRQISSNIVVNPEISPHGSNPFQGESTNENPENRSGGFAFYVYFAKRDRSNVWEKRWLNKKLQWEINEYAWIQRCIKALDCLHYSKWLSPSFLPDYYGQLQTICTR